MKAVILAAGRGKRLAPMGWDKPKCLLEFGDKTLLDHVIDSLLPCGVDRVVVVVGYRRELVLKALGKRPVRVEVVINEQYAETNTINSLYLAREHLDEDFIYFNADVLFDPRIVGELLHREGNVFAIDEKACGEEEVKVIVDGDGRIARIGKALPGEQCMGEFIGVGTFALQTCPALVESLGRFNEQLNERNLFFESAVDAILDKEAFWAMSIGDMQAVEIDSPEDYEHAARLWEDVFSRQ